MKVRKAVIPVAGLGTRFLPATKACPKELLPIVDVPAIQVVVEEVLHSGIEQVILITGRGKEAILDHFDYSYELEDTLTKRGKTDLVEAISAISRMVSVVSIRQKQPLGLGHAILVAQEVIGSEPFAVLLPDDLFEARIPVTRQLMETSAIYGTGVVALIEVPRELTHRYGIIDGEQMEEGLYRVLDLVEKPDGDRAPSTLALPGRYILPPAIFKHLAVTRPGVNGEIQLTDGLARLAREEGLLGRVVEGTRHDIGDKLGFLQANISFALRRPDLGPELRRYLERELSKE
ncbi:MAG: UTP--glucose-1-phosphate uridylyltransferase GalU [Bradymonadales bacterium]|nr:UTP--glucose-1-phosphate uridylyltransferase GalU [Bradymonadales bacterium]